MVSSRTEPASLYSIVISPQVEYSVSRQNGVLEIETEALVLTYHEGETFCEDWKVLQNETMSIHDKYALRSVNSTTEISGDVVITGGTFTAKVTNYLAEGLIQYPDGWIGMPCETHTPAVTESVAPGCTKPGKTEGEHCSSA